MKKDYLNKEVCRACNGKCCKKIPGCAMPQDFGPEINLDEALKIALASGKWAVDWIENVNTEERSYFIRPGIKGHVQVYDWANMGECVFFLEHLGCQLSDSERPTGCRLLEPKPSLETCVAHGGSKDNAIIAWRPFRMLILAAAEAQHEDEHRHESP